MASRPLGRYLNLYLIDPGASAFSTRAVGRHRPSRIEILPSRHAYTMRRILHDTGRGLAKSPKARGTSPRREASIAVIGHKASALSPSPLPCLISLKHFGARRQTSGRAFAPEPGGVESLPCHSLPFRGVGVLRPKRTCGGDKRETCSPKVEKVVRWVWIGDVDRGDCCGGS